MFYSSKEFPKDIPLGRICEYNIESAKNPKNQDIFEINESLIFICDLSFGKIYRHQNNKDYWFLTQSIARRISDEQLDFFYKWDKTPQLFSEEQFQILLSIGGLPSTQYQMVPDYLHFPCKVITKDGREIDLCIIHFSKAPPFQSYFHNLILLSDIQTIKPSELTLGYNLRLSSLSVDEIRMGFAPFVVKTKDNKLITYDGSIQFASTGEVKGTDITEEVDFTYKNFDDKISNVPFEKMTFVIGQWDDRIETIFKQYRADLEKKQNRYTNATTLDNGNSVGHFFKNIWAWLIGDR
jgi:hypothetical protein